ncbi:MAG: NADH-ubiquinone oxidoreductase-F iron-sulfur binding region domain-containing protein [Gammaproteobacteria bacterium]
MSVTEQEIVRLRHPGRGKRKSARYPKGRQVDPAALQEVRDLIGAGTPRRDLLIEYLHLIQDCYGYLSVARLAALASELKLSQTEVYEVASFYSHFDVVGDNEQPPPSLTVRVCDSLSCEMAGGKALLDQLSRYSGSDTRVVAAPCMGRCHQAPVAAVGHYHVDHADLALLQDAIDTKKTRPTALNYRSLEDYRSGGGYETLGRCLAGDLSVDDVIGILDQSALRGLGGAGFPPGRKWKIVRGYGSPRMMAVNADEGEPGTFKDRYHLENDPHRVLEGMLIAAWAVQAESVYFYLRDEYPAIRECLQEEFEALRATGLSAHTRIELRRGAGAYICGEESAMIESIEGKRGLPRHRPPYVAEVGIFDRPTLINNVETLYWVRDIIEKGAEWYAGHGRNECKGLRSFSVSGRVREPGVKLAPAGITARDLLEDFCGGMPPGHTFRAYLPGGASGGILPADKADLPLDFETLSSHDCFVGSHAVIFLSDQDDMKAVVRNLLRFFEDESCGQCTPCRVGTEKAVSLMKSDSWDKELLQELGRVMADASICGLGQAAANPMMSLMRFFPEEFES